MENGIELIDIEGELNRLWDGIESKRKIRAALFNLIVYIQDRAHLDYVERITRFVLKKLPCRVIFLIFDPAATEHYLRTRVSVEMVGTGDQPISCDQIRIEFSPAHRDRVPFLVFPHLLPDLPISLLWEGDPEQAAVVFPPLEKLAGRLLFDPDSLRQLSRFAKFTLDLMENFDGDIADQKWGCCEGWRTVIRQAFASQENLTHLERVKEITFHYTERESDFPRDSRIQPFYLQAWLASRLGWTFSSFTENEISYKRGGESLLVRMVAERRDTEPYGTVVAIELNSYLGGHFSFTHAPKGNFVQIKSDSPEKCDLPYTLYLQHLKREESFARELLRTGMSRHYCDTLRYIAEHPIYG